MEQVSLFDRSPTAAPKALGSPAPQEKQIRPYQNGAITCAERDLSEVRSTLVVLPCGCGKTTVATELIKRAKQWRVLWLAHRDFLIQQARETLEDMCKEFVSVEQNVMHADDSRIVVGTVQTLRGRRLRSHRPDKFDLIVVDEAHHAPAKSYRDILDHFRSARVLGLTATPNRHDKIGQWVVFDRLAYELELMKAIDDGYLCEPIPVGRYIDSIDLRRVKSSGDDLNMGQVEEEITKNAAAIAQLTFQEVGDRPTIVYTPGVVSAHAVAATLNKLKPGSAVAVDQSTPPARRKDILRRFKAGELQYICNCAIYVEGLDVPTARAVVIARPTKSESLYIQMALRGGRPEGWIGQLATREERLAAIAASSKPDFLLLDITGKAGKHKLMSAARALAGKDLPPDVAAKTDEVTAGQQTKKLRDMIDQAKLEVEEDERAEINKAAEAAAQAEVKARRKLFDPFRRFGIDENTPATAEEQGQPPGWVDEPATDEQVEWLKKNRLKSKDVRRGIASKLQQQAKDWRDAGKATFKQRAVLRSAHAPEDVSFVMASRLIDAWTQKNGRRKDWGHRDPLTQAEVDSCLNQREVGEEG